MAERAVLTGRHFMMGNFACAEGALAAGCRFAAGYPITPATEVAERLAERLPAIGGTFLQMEDEIASMAAIIGASWGGMKTLTATSGPGVSLMLENIGFAVGTETPCVIVNVMRGGPTTGIPTVELQGDVIQVRRGSHGDYQIIALAPSSVQECFDYTVEAFNLAERFRTPVFVLTDAFLGHMREELLIPEPAASAPSAQAMFPIMKCRPVRTAAFAIVTSVPGPLQNGQPTTDGRSVETRLPGVGCRIENAHSAAREAAAASGTSSNRTTIAMSGQ